MQRTNKKEEEMGKRKPVKKSEPHAGQVIMRGSSVKKVQRRAPVSRQNAPSSSGMNQPMTPGADVQFQHNTRAQAPKPTCLQSMLKREPLKGILKKRGPINSNYSEARVSVQRLDFPPQPPIARGNGITNTIKAEPQERAVGVKAGLKYDRVTKTNSKSKEPKVKNEATSSTPKPDEPSPTVEGCNLDEAEKGEGDISDTGPDKCGGPAVPQNAGQSQGQFAEYPNESAYYGQPISGWYQEMPMVQMFSQWGMGMGGFNGMIPPPMFMQSMYGLAPRPFQMPPMMPIGATMIIHCKSMHPMGMGQNWNGLSQQHMMTLNGRNGNDSDIVASKKKKR